MNNKEASVNTLSEEEIITELTKVVSKEKVLDLLEIAKLDNWSPLHWASALGSPELVKKFIESGCDVNAIDVDGNTPLHTLAVFQSRVSYDADALAELE